MERVSTTMSKKLYKRLNSKIKENAGFSLTEMLVAMLIMLLATGALTMTINLAIKHFYKSTQESEAQVLCATLSEFVEDELTFANVSEPYSYSWSGGTHNMGNGISFFIKDATSYTKIKDDTDSNYGQLVITGNNYAGNYFNAANSASYEVGKSRSYDLAASMSLVWENGKYKVNIRVVDKDNNSEVLSRAEFTVKPIVVS